MYLLSALHGHGTSSSPVGQRRADRVQAGHELPVLAEHVERGLAHAGHDPHRDRDVGRVGELDADVALVGAQRAHAERDDVHRAALHRPAEQVGSSSSRISAGVAPVVRRAGVVLVLGADERAVLDAGDVAGVRPGQVGVRALGVGRASRTFPRRRARCTDGRTPRPSRRTSGSVGLRERGHLLDPGDEPGVLRRDSRLAHVLVLLGRLRDDPGHHGGRFCPARPGPAERLPGSHARRTAPGAADGPAAGPGSRARRRPLGRGAARRATPRPVVPTVRVPAGSWRAEEIRPPAGRPFVALVVEGVVVREVLLGGDGGQRARRARRRRRPRHPGGRGPRPRLGTLDDVGAPRIVALLGDELLPALRGWPSVAAALVARAARRAARVEVQRGISQLPRVEDRLLALLGHLADRFGPRGRRRRRRAASRLTHEMLGRLVGRPPPDGEPRAQAARPRRRRSCGAATAPGCCAPGALDHLAAPGADGAHPGEAAAIALPPEPRRPRRSGSTGEDLRRLADRCARLRAHTEVVRDRSRTTSPGPWRCACSCGASARGARRAAPGGSGRRLDPERPVELLHQDDRAGDGVAVAAHSGTSVDPARRSSRPRRLRASSTSSDAALAPGQDVAQRLDLELSTGQPDVEAEEVLARRPRRRAGPRGPRRGRSRPGRAARGRRTTTATPRLVRIASRKALTSSSSSVRWRSSSLIVSSSSLVDWSSSFIVSSSSLVDWSSSLVVSSSSLVDWSSSLVVSSSSTVDCSSS